MTETPRPTTASRIQEGTATTGRCLCGSVRYRSPAGPLFTAICHCRNCRRQTGSAYSLVAGFPADGFRIEGSTGVFPDVGESGLGVARHFCPACGSPIVSILEALPEMVIVKAGTLDGDDLPPPSIEVFCDDALAFLPAFPAAERFPRSNLGAAA